MGQGRLRASWLYALLRTIWECIMGFLYSQTYRLSTTKTIVLVVDKKTPIQGSERFLFIVEIHLGRRWFNFLYFGAVPVVADLAPRSCREWHVVAAAQLERAPIAHEDHRVF